MPKTRPSFGYAIVRRVAPGKSEGGIDLPPSAESNMASFYLVTASAGHMQDGRMIECAIPEGARIWIAPSTRTVPNPHQRGGLLQEFYLRTLDLPGSDLAEDERVVMLCDVIAHQPIERVLQ